MDLRRGHCVPKIAGGFKCSTIGVSEALLEYGGNIVSADDTAQAPLFGPRTPDAPELSSSKSTFRPTPDWLETLSGWSGDDVATEHESSYQQI